MRSPHLSEPQKIKCVLGQDKLGWAMSFFRDAARLALEDGDGDEDLDEETVDAVSTEAVDALAALGQVVESIWPPGESGPPERLPRGKGPARRG